MPTAPARPRIDDAVLRRLVDELLDDATLWDITDIARALAVDKKRAEALARVTANYVDGGATQWPPVGDALRQRLPPRGHAEGATGWPPSFSALPPPATPPGERPRWRAGDVRRWAMQVGRMNLDGTPVPASALPRHGYPARVSEDSPRPELDPVQIERVQELCDDDALWTQADIVKFFDVTQGRVAQWAAATREMAAGRCRHWPPSNERGPGRKVSGWPPSLSMLPPPVEADPLSWRAGEVVRWGLMTGRITVEWLLEWAATQES
jgi:hypothetical protein